MVEGIKALNLRLPEKKFVKLKKKKDASGLTWEEWILRVAGTEEE